MKIFFDGVIFSWQKGGGVVRYFFELFKGISKNKEVDMEFLINQPYYSSVVKELSLNKKFNSNNIVNWPFVFGFFRRLLKSYNNYKINKYFKSIDKGVFHSTYYTTYKNLKIPQVLTLHDMIYEQFPSFFGSNACKRFIKQKKKCIDVADHIICISQTVKKDLLSIYSIPENKISVVYHGVSEKFKVIDNNRLKDDIKIKYKINYKFVLFVGNRAMYKNFILFIKAYANWPKNRDISIVVVGGGKINKEEKKLINKLNIKYKIKFLGYVPEDDLIMLYNMSDFFIFPSLCEGFGLPILEASCCGTRVLVSDIDIFREIGENFVEYFEPNNIDDLIHKMTEILKKPRINNKTIMEIKKKFDWKNTIYKTFDVYNKSINYNKKI